VSAEGGLSDATPDSLELRRHLELEGRAGEVHARRVLLALLAVIPALAILGLFGQRPSTASAESAAAALEVFSPTRARGGLLFTTEIEVTVRRDLRNAAIVLDPGWFEGMQLNNVTPAPSSQRSDHGRVVLALGTLAAGQRSVTFLEFQVNPTTVGRRSQDVELTEGGQALLHVSRSLTVFP
jgi:hypothetical protein